MKDRVAEQLHDVSFCYFEAHEGKNLSDAIGGLVKQSFLHGVRRTADDGFGSAAGNADQGETIAEQVKSRMLSGLSFNEEGKVGDFAFFR